MRGIHNPGEEELDKLIQNFIDEMPIKATEIGWEVVGERAQELKSDLLSLSTAELERREREARLHELQSLESSADSCSCGDGYSCGPDHRLLVKNFFARIRELESQS